MSDRVGRLDPDRWRQAHAAATTMVGRVPGALGSVASDAADVIAAVLYQWTPAADDGDPPIPGKTLRARIAAVSYDPDGDLQGLDVVVPSLQRWTRTDPVTGGRQPTEHIMRCVCEAVDQEILYHLGGVRLLDAVLAPLPADRTVLVPARVARLLDWQSRPGDAPQITVTVNSAAYQLFDVAVPADDLILDVLPGAEARLGRGTHAHAVRCLVADLRRAAYLISAGSPIAAVLGEGADRMSLYAAYEDLHLRLMSTFGVLAIDVSSHRRVRAEPQSLLAAISDGIQQAPTGRLRDTASTADFLRKAADTLEAEHL